MKPPAKKVDLPKYPFLEFINFIFAVLKRRIFLFFLFVAIGYFLLQRLLDGYAPPSIYYLGVVFIGFVWSAFQVYKDLSQTYREALSPGPVEKVPNSELTISFVEGNEYVYSISDPYFGQNHHITRMQKTRGVKCHFDERGVFYINGEVYYMMGKGSLEINMQLHNSGDLPLDVLSIDLFDDLNLNHLRLYSNGVFLHGGKLHLPFLLESGEFVTLQSRYEIFINKGSNEGLFVADFQSLPKMISHEISIDTLDVNGKRRTYVSEIGTSSKPLMDMYVKQWREYGQVEYLVLAGHGPEKGG